MIQLDSINLIFSSEHLNDDELLSDLDDLLTHVDNLVSRIISVFFCPHQSQS